MKLTIHPTDKLVKISGGTVREDVPARIWEGTDEYGTPVIVMVTRVLVHEDQPAVLHERFAEALKETRKATPAAQAIPLRLIL
jgi:hypothetical protein